MTKDDGGPAFPYSPACDAQGVACIGSYSADPGMSLRDWFAGQALAGNGLFGLFPLKEYTIDDAAMRAYEIADAMLAARKQEG